MGHPVLTVSSFMDKSIGLHLGLDLEAEILKSFLPFQWDEFLNLSKDVLDSTLQERIDIQAPNTCCSLIYTVSINTCCIES